MSRAIRVAPYADSLIERRKLVQLHGHTMRARIYRPSLDGVGEGQARYREAAALIDTGASHVFIDASIAGELALTERNAKSVSTIHGKIGGIGYSARLVVLDLEFSEFIEVIAMQASERRMNYEIVLGTSFLERFFFEYDGPNAQLVFHLPDRRADDDYAT